MSARRPQLEPGDEFFVEIANDQLGHKQFDNNDMIAIHIRSERKSSRDPDQKIQKPRLKSQDPL